MPRTTEARAETNECRREATEEDRRALRAFLRRRGMGDGTAKHPDTEAGIQTRNVLNRLAAILGYVDAEHCPWSQLEYEDMQAIVDDLRERCTPETINTYLATMRAMAGRAKKIGIAKDDPDAWHGILAYEPLPGEALRPDERERITYQEYRALLALCDEMAKTEPDEALRDKLLFKLLYLTGLRVSSVCALQLSSILTRKEDDGAGNVVERWYVRLRGQQRAKRSKEHLVPLDPDLVETLKEFLAVRGKWAGQLLTPVTTGPSRHQIRQGTLGRRSVYTILQKRCEAAGIPMRSAHKWRAAFITDAITAGGLMAAMVLADHADPRTTSGYDREGQERAKQTIDARHDLLSKQREHEEKAGD